MSPSLTTRSQGWLWPAPMAVTRAERVRMVCGAMLGILVTALASHALGLPEGLHWIVAPMGASAVLVFCVPASPLAQPWAVVVGNTISAVVGIACVHAIPSTDFAAAAAVSLAIAAMLALRSLHPPGGASALLMAISGVTNPGAALFPVLVNSLLLTAMGWAFHRATGHQYPHRPAPPHPSQVTEEDLDAVLARYNQILDVSRDELHELIDRTQRLAHERRLAHTRCADVMTRDVTTVEYATPLQEAWTLLRKHGLKTLPVIDRARHVVGIVTLTDFLEAASLDVHHGFDQRLRRFISRSRASHPGRPEVVGQIMTRKVRTTRAHRTLSDLVLLFNSSGHRHIPVLGEGDRLVGMVTQSDVVAALKVVDAIDAPLQD
ncbi:MAG: HPP family protein [Aquincola sp.]|nr:HPP family protein [Aquincola sp.]